MAQVNYAAVLDSAWRDHLAPRASNAPTVISTFAGCGGSSLGYSMAGFRELLAVEWDNNAVATFKLNFPDVPVYHGDICKLTVDECLSRAGLTGPRQLDVLDGSPPCQGFSTAGKRDLADDRNQLFHEFVRLLRGLQPKVFVMENVSGLVKGKMRLVFAEIMRELKASGYTVSARLLNAMYFNVPQSRERLIFIGVREDLQCQPTHPYAQAQPRVAGQALTGLADNPQERVNIKPTSLTLKQMSTVKPGMRSQIHHSRYRLSFAEPCITLDAGGSVPGWHIWHPVENRTLTLSETKRLAAFPDSFRFTNNLPANFKCVGNSVPPLFMRSIAQHVRTELLDG